MLLPLSFGDKIDDRKRHSNDDNLADFNTEVKRKEGNSKTCGRQPQFMKHTRESKPVHETKYKGNQPAFVGFLDKEIFQSDINDT